MVGSGVLGFDLSDLLCLPVCFLSFGNFFGIEIQTGWDLALVSFGSPLSGSSLSVFELY